MGFKNPGVNISALIGCVTDRMLLLQDQNMDSVATQEINWISYKREKKSPKTHPFK